MKVVLVGPFGLSPRMTMRVRALPLGKALVRRGHDVTLLLPPWQNPQDDGRQWEDEGVEIHNVNLPGRLPGWFHWRLTARMVQHIHKIAPDVLHVFKPKAYAGLTHYALRRRYPVVVDTDDWEGPGGWNTHSDYPAWMKRFFTWQERWGIDHADAMTVASRALQTLVWARGVPPNRVFYLPNGVNPPPAEAERPEEGRPTMLLYTRFFEFDLDRLWRIVAGVRKRKPDARLIVTGAGFDREEKTLLANARQAGWTVSEVWPPNPQSDLVNAGWGTDETLPLSFALADVALYPFDDTLFNRTKCPMKLMDLQAAGIAVVADAVGQIAETIESGRTGLLVPPGDEQAFIEALLMLLESPQRCRAMGMTAQASISRRFDWDRLSRTAEAAYQRGRSHFARAN
jgi:glycosyltransferase involved in cell wall biosynthesis